MFKRQTQDAVACTVCGSRSVFKCSRCKRAFYCGIAHQKEHWPTHKNKCRPSVIHSVRLFSPKDCFMDAQRVKNRGELALFVNKSLTKVGICVLDNFVRDASAAKLAAESKVLDVRMDDSTLQLTENDLKMCPSISQLYQDFHKLVQSTIVDKFKYSSKKMFSKNPIRSQVALTPDSKPSPLLNCSYFAKQTYSTEKVTRYLMPGEKLLDLQAKYNRVVLFLSDGRVIVEDIRMEMNLFVISSVYSLLNLS